jgi:hypothetical protein
MFKVLSWNISWGAMSGNPNDMSTKYLSLNKCYKEANNNNNPKWCMNNVINFLINLDEHFHFIGLQEASNWEYIINKLNKYKNNLFGVINTISGVAKLVTFYLKDLYIVIKIIEGHILKKGRPYHIIIFCHKITLKYYIIINLHNGHGNNTSVLEYHLSRHINELSDELVNRRFRVIALGDFNDNNKFNYWKGLKPFKNLDNNVNDTLKNTVLSYTKKPPKTCCVGKTSIRKKLGDDKMIGDYILINNKFKNIKLIIPHTNPHIKNGLEYNANINPTSDHLPIIAIINK